MSMSVLFSGFWQSDRVEHTASSGMACLYIGKVNPYKAQYK